MDDPMDDPMDESALARLARHRFNTVLPDAFANHDDFDGLQQYDHIEQQAVIFQIIKIVLQLFFSVFARCAIWIA